MRTYYIFNINKEMGILTKDSPYMLFKSLESIYKSNKNDLHIASSLYEQLSVRINKNVINQIIINNNKDNDFYTFQNNHHKYYNKYREESCDIEVKNSYIICTSNTPKLILLNKLSEYNLFVCDFDYKDYFWLNEVYC